MRRDDERLADIIEATEKISVRVGKGRRQIVAIRNRVVHGYFEVDLDILWDVAVVDVPHLADQVRAIRSTAVSEENEHLR